MRMLVIGGGHFLGPAVVSAGLEAGHEVTTLTRTGAGVPAGAESLLGDRETAEGLALLAGREWDFVVDTCGYVPRVVGAGARALAGSAGHYVFVSSVSAYDGWPERPVRDGTPTLPCPPDAGAEDGHYGELKAGCERAVQEVFAGRCTIARAGHIVGVGDNVGRLPWWILRVAAGGDVLAPGPAERPLSMVDARDLGSWLVHCGQFCVAGAVAASGPPGQTSFGELLGAARDVTRADATFVWADDAFLVAQGVEPWIELPYWLPAAQFPGGEDVDTSAALAAGLHCRPVADTVRDTWQWLRDAGPVPHRSDRPVPGLPPEREREVLAAWHEAHPDGDVASILQRKRAELEQQLLGLETPTGDGGGISFGKRVGEGTSVAVERLAQVAAHEGLGAMLLDVSRAQAKLTEGSYGSCDVCGKAIGPERLAALPWATHCVSCAGKR